MAVDAVAGDEDWFLEEAQRSGARIVHVIDTHVHADHYSGGHEMAGTLPPDSMKDTVRFNRGVAD